MPPKWHGQGLPDEECQSTKIQWSMVWRYNGPWYEDTAVHKLCSSLSSLGRVLRRMYLYVLKIYLPYLRSQPRGRRWAAVGYNCIWLRCLKTMDKDLSQIVDFYTLRMSLNPTDRLCYTIRLQSKAGFWTVLEDNRTISGYWDVKNYQWILGCQEISADTGLWRTISGYWDMKNYLRILRCEELSADTWDVKNNQLILGCEELSADTEMGRTFSEYWDAKNYQWLMKCAERWITDLSATKRVTEDGYLRSYSKYFMCRRMELGSNSNLLDCYVWYLAQKGFTTLNRKLYGRIWEQVNQTKTNNY